MTETEQHSVVYQHHQSARSPRLAVALALWAAGLVALLVLLSPAIWIILLFGLPLLPGLWELWRNPTALLELDAQRLSWRNATSAADIPLEQISHIRLDKRWDFSHRTTVHTRLGKRLCIPPDCQPPHRPFEQALAQAGLRVERHHFRIY
ncbi:hypothetical protein [Phaeobacter porticola]|uniref:Uncharacterized protein n=1 Tax=Phaeobacter porticola TaxID=1844006 RepID=A0A1L3I2Q5_9RHOB|nr:hypothetical protein [Phaeobacter porticola]APG46386.1 hypothetical protein PhaeoP97_00959 [Phaeobacter porticola]